MRLFYFIFIFYVLKRSQFLFHTPDATSLPTYDPLPDNLDDGELVFNSQFAVQFRHDTGAKTERGGEEEEEGFKGKEDKGEKDF